MAKHIDNFDPFTFDDEGIEEEKADKAFGDRNEWFDNMWGVGNVKNRASSDSQFFPFSAKEAANVPENDLFPSDPMATLSGDKLAVTSGTEESTKVRIAIREQFSTIYDDNGSTSEGSLGGSIHVQSTSDKIETTPFCLIVKDSENNLATLRPAQEITENITQFRKDLEEGDTALRVTLPPNPLSETPVATYKCNPQLRPIPMLVKSRVQVSNDLSRVGLKFRANPSNPETLNKMVIIMAVPPFVQGETVKMSRKGGIWDGMKRTLCWSVEKLDPGEVLEIQAQFQSVNIPNSPQQQANNYEHQFPVLVRCQIQRLFSAISVATDGIEDEKSTPVKNTVTQCTRILHRKV